MKIKECKLYIEENRQNSESCNQLVSLEIKVSRSICIGFEQTGLKFQVLMSSVEIQNVIIEQ